MVFVPIFAEPVKLIMCFGAHHHHTSFFLIVMNKKQSLDSLNRPSAEEYRAAPKHPIIVVMDDIRSLSNVGSIFRTCDSFNIQKIVLCGITGSPPHRDIQRTALGATESVEWTYKPNAIEEIKRLKNEGYLIISLEQCEITVHPHKLNLPANQPVCLVLGNEVSGVNQAIVDLSDLVMEIPQKGTKHSLNVTVAAGIALWELFKRYESVE